MKYAIVKKELVYDEHKRQLTVTTFNHFQSKADLEAHVAFNGLPLNSYVVEFKEVQVKISATVTP